MHTLCTPQLAKTICDNITLGLSNRDAAVLAGVTESTYYGWLRRAEAELVRVAASSRARVRKSEQPFIDFHEAIQAAIPKRKRLLVGHIQRAAAGGRQTTEKHEKVLRGPNGEMHVIERRTVTRESSPEWQAAAWILERNHPDEFGKRQRVDMNVSWQQELMPHIKNGTLSYTEVESEIGSDLATELFTAAGVPTNAGGSTQKESRA